MNNDIFADYALLDAQIDELTNKKEAMRVEILQKMIADGLKTQDHPLGKFTIAKLTKWSYPESVLQIEEEVNEKISSLKDQLKSAQKKAQSTEEATCVETESLKFTKLTL